MKTYRIFLASSAELKADRLAYETFINRENKRLQDKNVFLQLEIWEDAGDGMSRTRSQDEYNRLLIECDLFVMLYWTKVGKYTNEEYDLARVQFLSSYKPKKIYTYRKTLPPITPPSQTDTDSLTAFEEKLSGLELFPINYDSAEALQLDFDTKLKDLFDDGTLVHGGMAKCLSAGQPAVPEGFIGRDDELRTIRHRMNNGGTLMLINSEGGMGKTSIAAKYWKENQYTYTHNAWLFCENGIVEEIKKLAPQLNLELVQIPEEQHVAALRTALQNLPADCLLVLDNANNPEDIKAFKGAFSGLHWHVLITSRCQHVLEKQQELFIEHLPPDLAKELFISYYNEKTPAFESLLDRLLHAIGYNTLLIELFAKNMAELAAFGETLADLLKQLEETKSLFLGERSFEVVTPYTTTTHKKGATTDEIIDALYDLTKMTESDRFRLVNLALLPAESHLLTVLIELFAPDDKFRLHKELASLAQRGWLTTDTKSYRLSPVVQKIVLEKNKESLWQDGKILVFTMTNLLQIDPDSDNIKDKFKWVNYAQSLNGNFIESNALEYSYFQNNLAVVLREKSGRNNLIEAKALLEKALENDILNLGENSPEVARDQRNLALVLLNLGSKDSLNRARILLENALNISVINFGKKHLLVAEAQANLAGVLKDLSGISNLQKAIYLLKESLNTTIAKLGEMAPVVAVRQSNLATVLQSLGGKENLLQAETLSREALKNAILNFDKQAPTVAIRQTNLAVVLSELGEEEKLNEAKILLKQAMDITFYNFGENDSRVAVIESNLADVVAKLGGVDNLDEAIVLQRKALANSINNFGISSPIVAMRKSNLATILLELEKDDNLYEAKTLLQEALANDTVNFGIQSFAVAIRQTNLASVLFRLGDQKAACQLWLQAYWVFRKLYSDEHGRTQTVLEALYEYCPECFEQR